MNEKISDTLMTPIDLSLQSTHDGQILLTLDGERGGLDFDDNFYFKSFEELASFWLERCFDPDVLGRLLLGWTHARNGGDYLRWFLSEPKTDDPFADGGE